MTPRETQWLERVKRPPGPRLARTLRILVAIMIGVVIAVAIVIPIIVARAAMHGIVDAALRVLDRASKNRSEDGELPYRDLETDRGCSDRIADPLARIWIVAAGEIAQSLAVAAAMSGSDRIDGVAQRPDIHVHHHVGDTPERFADLGDLSGRGEVADRILIGRPGLGEYGHGQSGCGACRDDQLTQDGLLHMVARIYNALPDDSVARSAASSLSLA